jgi:hypothetical protein
MTTTNTKPGAVALAHIGRYGSPNSAVEADLRALIAERDNLKERLQDRRNEVQRLEDALHDKVLTAGHDAMPAVAALRARCERLEAALREFTDCDLGEILHYFNSRGDAAPCTVFLAQEHAREVLS